MATNELAASCPPEAVFRVLANGWLYPTWVVGASRMRGVDPAWPAPGARIHHSFGVWPAVLDDRTECLEWDAPRRAVLRAHGWPLGSARIQVDAVATGAGCLITITEDVDGGPGRLVPKPARDALTLVRNAETLKRMRYLAEGGA